MSKTQIGYEVAETYRRCRLLLCRIKSTTTIAANPPVYNAFTGKFCSETKTKEKERWVSGFRSSHSSNCKNLHASTRKCVLSEGNGEVEIGGYWNCGQHFGKKSWEEEAEEEGDKNQWNLLEMKCSEEYECCLVLEMIFNIFIAFF